MACVFFFHSFRAFHSFSVYCLFFFPCRIFLVPRPPAHVARREERWIVKFEIKILFPLFFCWIRTFLTSPDVCSNFVTKFYSFDQAVIDRSVDRRTWRMKLDDNRPMGSMCDRLNGGIRLLNGPISWNSGRIPLQSIDVRTFWISLKCVRPTDVESCLNIQVEICAIWWNSGCIPQPVGILVSAILGSLIHSLECGSLIDNRWMSDHWSMRPLHRRNIFVVHLFCLFWP